MGRPEYPPAERLDLVEQLHGRAVADPYRWLEDVEDPRTAAWRAAQDRLCRDWLDALPGRDRLRERLTALLRVGAVGTPAWRGGSAFWTRRDPDQEHGVLRRRGADGDERVLVDPAALDPAGLTTLDAWSPSKEGARLAYQLSRGGDEESLLHVVDVATGELLDGPIDRCRYSPVAWVPGGQELYYVRRLPPEVVPDGEEQFHRRVWRHAVGTSTEEDVEVWGEGLDVTNYYGCSVSLDGRWLLVSASAGTAPRDDVWLFDREAGGPPEQVQVGVDAHCSPWIGRDGRLWLLTDRDAPRGRLCVADPERPQDWAVVLPEDDEAVLEDVELLDGDDGPVLVVLRTRHAISEIAVHDLTGRHLHDVRLPGLGSVGGLSAPPEGGPRVWFTFTSATTPAQALVLDVRTREVSVWQEAPGRPALGAVHEQVLEAVSRDGTVMRLQVLAPPGTADRPRPAVLYGYGGFGVSLTPSYSASALAWVEAGGVWAVANLRGGGEEGEQWHRAGMRGAKQNVFDDFAACAETLVTAGFTSPRQLGIYGGSNGGLLVGAALTQRPSAYAAVVCSAPLLDMVRYELFGLGRTWNDEFGTAAVAEELGWLLAYSPYHAVRDGEPYPAVLLTVFDGDSRVDPLHARKMCAALQAATSSDAPVLLRDERGVGHGARSVSRTAGLAVDTLAFLASHTGLELTP
ncbi:MAG TPA: prolyl oligopeptidase family serine peptidase [Mycobacteriales bacterium]|nr:prolyl oligopeptidase family serine peptidase [Mycobacteriales bacterium]